MEKLKEFICRDSVKVRGRIFLIVVLVSILLMLIGIEIKFFFILGIPLYLLSILYAFLAFRCPHCDAFLGTRIPSFDHCPKCGNRIEK